MPADLRGRWRALVGETLPAAARLRPDWPVRLDHCFARILLDNSCGRPWREVVPPPAWRTMPEPDLARAVALGEAVLSGAADLAALNRRSLALRGKVGPSGDHRPAEAVSEVARIAVLGGGAWGTALANAAASAGRDVTLWLRDPAAADAMARSRENAARLPGVALHARVAPTADPRRLCGAEAALLVVPAQSVRAALEGIGRDLPAGCPIVVCAKGIERGTGLAMTEVAACVRPREPVAILSGPSFAADVARGLPTAVTLACRDEALGRRLATALSGPSFRVYRSADVRGVEIGGAAKNVLAIAAGIVIGRGLGESARAALVARGFAEMRRFAERQGARPETLMGLSGLGDLVLTCGSPQSRNFALGLRLGRGEPVDPAAGRLAEGAFTADALVVLARASGVEMPISEAVGAVLAGTLSVEAASVSLLSRPLRAE